MAIQDSYKQVVRLLQVGRSARYLAITETPVGMVQYDGSTSDTFSIKSVVKQGCVLAPNPV